jgi:hypothetical protein
MRFSYRLIHHRSGFIAECMELEAAGEGRTAREAVESLRHALEERMFRPHAIAPPSEPAEGTIELTLADESAPLPRRSIEVGRPGSTPR